MITDILTKITILMGQLGYPGLLIASIGVLPAELVITMVAATKPNELVPIALTVSLGEVFGALWTYAVGYYFRNKDILSFLTGKGQFLKITENSFNKNNQSIKKYGLLYILISRFVPALRVVVLVLAGYLKYNIFLSSIAVFIGTFVYAYGFAYLGSEIGLNWEQIKKMMDMINNILAIVTILVIGFLAYKNRQKIKKFLNLKSTK